jgi:hypothetical protein
LDIMYYLQQLGNGCKNRDFLNAWYIQVNDTTTKGQSKYRTQIALYML